MEKLRETEKLLPGFNCGACGFQSCTQFSLELVAGNVMVEDCSVLLQERFKEKRLALQYNIAPEQNLKNEKVIGLIDGVKADFLLHPLQNEFSCRETLICFAPACLEENKVIRYRPLGCPIIHFAQIIEVNNGLLDVWMIGPSELLNRNEEFIDVGICMIVSFQGIIEGVIPKVGQTVKFLPAHCMMGKVHSGIIVQLEENRARIDCIDLKVWQHAR